MARVINHQRNSIRRSLLPGPSVFAVWDGWQFHQLHMDCTVASLIAYRLLYNCRFFDKRQDVVHSFLWITAGEGATESVIKEHHELVIISPAHLNRFFVDALGGIHRRGFVLHRKNL